MRLSVNKDKLEELLNRRCNPDKVSRWVFPYKLALETSKFSFAETVLISLRLPLLLTVFVEGLHGAIVVGVGFYFYFYEHFPLRHILAFYRLRPHQVMDGVYAPFILFPVWFMFNLLLSLLQRWAWNRRADRLSRQVPLPSSMSVALPGVWPPPPTQS